MAIIKPHITRIARDFWSLTGKKYSPGCDIIGAVHLVLPVDIISLSELSLVKIERWLLERGVGLSIEADNRVLHGFIITHAGSGIIFINGTDSEEERRYTIAHEISHFILDYKIPRDKAIAKMGNQITEVLDGLRNATVEERIDGLLGDIRVQPYTHLLEKTGDGSFNSVTVFDAENEADSLAVELLAPNSNVIKNTKNGQSKISFSDFQSRCLNLLVSDYMLPETVAKEYAVRLSYLATGAPSLISKLGL